MSTPAYQDLLDRARRAIAEHPEVFFEESRLLTRQRDAEILVKAIAKGMWMANTTLSGLTVGRMVHYVTRQGQHYPAIVTEVTDAKAGIACLSVFDPQSRGTHFVDGVSFDPHGAQTESWHWIERAE